MCDIMSNKDTGPWDLLFYGRLLLLTWFCSCRQAFWIHFGSLCGLGVYSSLVALLTLPYTAVHKGLGAPVTAVSAAASPCSSHTSSFLIFLLQRERPILPFRRITLPLISNAALALCSGVHYSFPFFVFYSFLDAPLGCLLHISTFGCVECADCLSCCWCVLWVLIHCFSIWFIYQLFY